MQKKILRMRLNSIIKKKIKLFANQLQKRPETSKYTLRRKVTGSMMD